VTHSTRGARGASVEERAARSRNHGVESVEFYRPDAFGIPAVADVESGEAVSEVDLAADDERSPGDVVADFRR